MKRRARLILIIFLSVNVLPFIFLVIMKRIVIERLILKKAYYEFELGFKRKYEELIIKYCMKKEICF